MQYTYLFDARLRNSLLNLGKYAMSNGVLTLVMPTGTVLHVRLTFAYIFHEFAVVRVRDTHPRPRSNQGGYSSTLFHMCAHDDTTVRRGELDFCYVSFLSLSLSFGIVACARLERVGALL